MQCNKWKRCEKSPVQLVEESNEKEPWKWSVKCVECVKVSRYAIVWDQDGYDDPDLKKFSYYLNNCILIISNSEIDSQENRKIYKEINMGYDVVVKKMNSQKKYHQATIL
ncbi:MAG: hypothetical protein Solumvirus2_61 [Solumvirus sp.]|uniref:Uncharacterized protein n=1 Tax=Solumvirus sp. TaxID=2487773 RepID=A0A3G5AI38_9VIRU|nr:MAG: hypothetical protein Solumvirus2_61 [Solumvirus sp.]